MERGTVILFRSVVGSALSGNARLSTASSGPRTDRRETVLRPARRRRRQFGCSSMEPGKFGCSASASKSSSGYVTSGAGVAATNASASSTARTRPAARSRRAARRRRPGTPATSGRDRWRALPSRARRGPGRPRARPSGQSSRAIRCPRRAPAGDGGKSCIVVVAVTPRSQSRGGLKPSPFTARSTTAHGCPAGRVPAIVP